MNTSLLSGLFPIPNISPPKQKEEKEDDTRIPIPLPPEFSSQNTIPNRDIETKHGKAYEAFCRWSGLPESLRDPKTMTAFEKKWKLPDRYTNHFKLREDYKDKTLTHFWEWMIEHLPEVVYSVYKRAITTSSKDAGLFIEMVSKHLNLEKPRVTVSPMVLVGVPQDKIDKLFTAKGYENIEDITPKK